MDAADDQPVPALPRICDTVVKVPKKYVAQSINSTPQTPAGDKTFDKAVDLTDTVAAIVKEVAEVLHHAPFVKTLSGVILQIIKIRQELKVNKERCQEIIDRALNLSHWIYKKLEAIAKSGERAQENFTLKDVSDKLEKYQSRNKLSKLMSRGLEDLYKLDRRIANLETQLVMDIVYDIKLQQAMPSSNENPATASLASSDNYDHVLPPKPHLMVEREAQLDTALKILLDATPSRLAILGGGGFGKTTLARSILNDPQIVGRYDFRYFLSCEGMTDVNAVILGFKTMLGIRTAPSTVLAAARRLMSTSTTLLCLDNFETPWEPSASRTKVEDFLASIADIPNLSLIITMRGTQRPSKVAWSHPLMPPLSTLSSDAAQQILRSICPDHIIDDYTQKLFDVIDGIPLAVTLMANLFRDGETSQSLWNRWSKRQTHVIQTGGDDRESNLDTSIVLSVESHRMKRDPDATTMLAVLSLLPSGFPSDTLSILEEYLGMCDIHATIKTLWTVSLIETSASGRIQMLSPIRFFCLNFLSSKTLFILKKVVNYYVSLTLYCGNYIGNPSVYDRIAPEIPNIHSVFQRAYSAGYSKDITGLVYATMCLNSWSLYIGYLSQDTIKLALKSSIDIPILYANCLLSLGQLYDSGGHKSGAEGCFREASQYFKREKNVRGEACALHNLGDLLFFMQKFDQAESAYKTSLELYNRYHDNKQGQASVSRSLGALYASTGRYSEAEENLSNALKAHKQTSNLVGQANAAEGLTCLHFLLGDLVQAEECAIESLGAAWHANYAIGEGNALWWLGRIYLRANKLTDAKQVLEQALAIAKRQNSVVIQLNVVSDLAKAYIQSDMLSAAEALLMISAKVELEVIQVPIVLTTLAQVYLCGGHLEKAESYLWHAFELFLKFNDKSRQDDVLSLLGTVYLRSNRLADAEQVLKSIPGLGVCVHMQQTWVLGNLHVAKGRLDDAENALESAMACAEYDQCSYQQGNITRSLGTLYVKRGHVDWAIRAFKQALEFHRKAQWVSEQATDLELLGEAYVMLGKCTEAEAVFEEAEALMGSVLEARTLS